MKINVLVRLLNYYKFFFIFTNIINKTLLNWSVYTIVLKDTFQYHFLPLSERNSSCYTEEGKDVQEPKTKTNTTQAIVCVCGEVPPNPIINSNSVKSFIPSLLYINVNQFQHHPKSSTLVLKCSLSGAAGNSQPSESEQRRGYGVDGRSASCPEEERNKNGF
ncbi:uncharacterized protein LOC110414672 isoform X2 [Herrania umbratica]|uniref:Uncharacterized protein LOC110414672 isoform X2 n=1 Tax=Herrania umbratica TaxID=108875 RepID=A0A6J1A4R7_9ROSI|nr:uncharacterized protein LOC110414672 isoform X2 [Herrania umbratica]